MNLRPYVLKPYMGFNGDPQEGAALVFAHSSKEAKAVFWTACRGDIAGDDFTGARVRLLRDSDYLLAQADAEKLAASTPHVIDDVTGCKTCLQWGAGPLVDGECKTCADARAENPAGGLGRYLAARQRQAGLT